MYSIKSIQKDDLIRLSPLLQESFGDTFDLDDEITYFSQSLALSWFFLSDLGEPQGFIRCFEIETDLFLIDLYLKSSHQKKYTMMHF